MPRFRFDILLAMLVGFSLVFSNAPSRALAAGYCSPASTPGFNVASQSRGAMVTLCAHFVAVQTAPEPAKKHLSKTKTRPNNAVTVSPKPAPAPNPELALRLLHRKLARQGESSFSAQPLIIRANPNFVAVNRNVDLSVAHASQFHTAFLLSRFTSLRFIPLRIDFHFDVSTHQTSRQAFAGRVLFKKRGWHTIRGLVTYRAEYRLSGTKTWVRIAGQQQVAAVSARVWVNAGRGSNSEPSVFGSKPLLVANDCTQNVVSAGCLN